MEILDGKKGHNVASEINLIINSIPDELSAIEKVRWIYIKLGNIFSYDYRVASDINFGKHDVSINDEYISNYQTCAQISKIINEVYSKCGISSKTIVIPNNSRINYEIEHTGNLVELNTGEKYVLDLTLDLYLIQSGCLTQHFGKLSINDEDIISDSKLMAIDEETSLLKNNEYMDKKIRDLKSVINAIDYSSMSYDEELQYKVSRIGKLIPNFSGYNEGRLFVEKLLNDFNIDHHKYNFMYVHGEENKMTGCFQVYGDNNLWYVYDGNSGFIPVDAKKLKNMLDNGWSCKSPVILDNLEESLNSRSV